MGLLNSYLRLQIVVVTAVVLAVGALGVLTRSDTGLALLALFALVIAGFAALTVLFSVR